MRATDRHAMIGGQGAGSNREERADPPTKERIPMTGSPDPARRVAAQKNTEARAHIAKAVKALREVPRENGDPPHLCLLTTALNTWDAADTDRWQSIWTAEERRWQIASELLAYDAEHDQSSGGGLRTRILRLLVQISDQGGATLNNLAHGTVPGIEDAAVPAVEARELAGAAEELQRIVRSITAPFLIEEAS